MFRDEVVVESTDENFRISDQEERFVFCIQIGKFLVAGRNFDYCHKQRLLGNGCGKWVARWCLCDFLQGASVLLLKFPFAVSLPDQ